VVTACNILFLDVGQPVCLISQTGWVQFFAYSTIF
jgi:hypothetical protein